MICAGLLRVEGACPIAARLGVPLRVRVTMVRCRGFWEPLIISLLPL